MFESIPKEIIGIAYAAEWDNIKQFVKALISLTLDSEEVYSLIALNAIINKKKYEEYDVQIKTKAQIKLLTNIKEFEKITLYQYSEYKRNIIKISKDKDVIVLTAQYMGPEIDHSNYFDFSIYLDSFNLPYFSDNKGNVFECRELMEIIRNFKPKIKKKVKETKKTKKPKTQKSTVRKVTPKSSVNKEKSAVKNLTPKDMESSTYKNLTGKNSIYGGTITKAFDNWKLETHKKFQQKLGGKPYYKGVPTKKYKLYLNSLVKPSISKKTSPKKPKTQKSTVRKVTPKSSVNKEKVAVKNLTSKGIESSTYKNLTGKNSIYGGTITKAFDNWKLETHKKFQQKLGGKPYYKGVPTKKYKLYLNSLVKPSISKISSPKKPKTQKSTVRKVIPKNSVNKKKAAVKNLTPKDMESNTYKNLTGKNPIYGGTITKAFDNWKLETHKKFQQKLGGKPYYKGAPTKKYKSYLNSLNKS